jgi:ankyrin repeat protein
MGNSNSQETRDSLVDNFYLACRSSDVDAVKQILPTMKLKEINRIHSNGNTALHAAASHGHLEIVKLLLKYGCSTTTTNKYGKTAAQECEDERIRQLIQSSGVVTNNDEEMNDHTPKSKWCRLYENIDNQDKSVVATKVMKLRIKTYLTNHFTTNENN